MLTDIDIASYADDSTPFLVENNIDNVIESLEQVSDAFFIWFKNNRLKSNIDKRHVLVSTKKPVGIKFGDNTIDDIECEKLLGVKIDVNVKFNDHISDLRQKASRKISALARVIPFMGLSKRKLLKELRNRISHFFCVWSLFCSVRLYARIHFLPIHLEN